jgi:hypothetical protein
VTTVTLNLKLYVEEMGRI